MTTPLAFSIIGGMSASRRSTSTSGPNISPAAIRGRSAYATCPVAPVTTTRTALANGVVRAAVHGLGLDLHEDARVDEVDLHDRRRGADRKSTRLNSSHLVISY